MNKLEIGKRLTACLVAMVMVASVNAQTKGDSRGDTLAFNGTLRNAEYEVALRVNLYEQDVTVPGQELYGMLAGYLQRDKTSFCWLITSATVTDSRTALLEMVNDYGSEDLTAVLTYDGDSLYTLRQQVGSTLKVPKGGKWQRLPKVLRFKLME